MRALCGVRRARETNRDYSNTYCILLAHIFPRPHTCAYLARRSGRQNGQKETPRGFVHLWFIALCGAILLRQV